MSMRRIALFAGIAIALSVPAFAGAQTQYTLPDVIVTAPTFAPLAQAPTGQLNNLYSNTNNLSSYINNVFKIAISLGAMLAVLQLVRAGYIRMISGVGSWTSQSKAGEIISNAILGLLLLLGVYLVLYQINPCIVNLNLLNSSAFNSTSGQQCAAAS